MVVVEVVVVCSSNNNDMNSRSYMYYVLLDFINTIHMQCTKADRGKLAEWGGSIKLNILSLLNILVLYRTIFLYGQFCI